jgi:hypothetical protein
MEYTEQERTLDLENGAAKCYLAWHCVLWKLYQKPSFVDVHKLLVNSTQGPETFGPHLPTLSFTRWLA